MRSRFDKNFISRFISWILTRCDRSKKSTEYTIWRNQFLWQRLGLLLWIAIPIWCCGTALDVYYRFFYDSKTGHISPELYTSAIKVLDSSIMHDVAIAPLLLGLWMFHKTKWGHCYPAIIFLCFSWSATLLPEVFASVNGFALGNSDMWRLVFMAQAVLIPVRWRLHLISQLGVLVYYMGVNSVLGLEPIEGNRLVNLGWFFAIFWFCFICNLGVYLYDRLQKSEFESRRELRVFLHAISHDLRTPLMSNAIVLQNLLKKSQSQIIVNSSAIERLLEGNERQIALISALQEAYSMDAPSLKLYREPLQLSTIILSALHDLEPLLHRNRIIVKNLVSANLPFINADAIHLGRVLHNLINNALKHNPHGITLTVDACVKGKQILTRVQDNGVGISQQQHARVFELYTRGKNARFMPGLGLGLYVCRQIIEAHGGQIGVISQPGDGATFWFTLPLDESVT
jgi:signal transduction histidine kinase